MKNLIELLVKNSRIIFDKYGFGLENYSIRTLNDEGIGDDLIDWDHNFDFPLIEKAHLDIRNKNEFLGFAFGKLVERAFQNHIDKTNLLGVFHQMSQIALSLNFPEEAIYYSQLIIDISDPNSKTYAKSLESIAKSHRNLGNYSKAIEYYLKSKEQYLNLSDKVSETWILFHLGKMYLNYLHQPSRAALYLLQAKEQFEKIKGDDKYKYRGIASCYDELGDMYRQNTENISQAIIQYTLALEINKKHNYQRGMARNYAHLGLSFEAKGQIEDAISYLEKSIIILRGLERQEKGVGVRLIQLGSFYLKIGFYKKANTLIDEGLDVCKSYRIFHYLSRGLIFKAEILRQEGKIIDSIELLKKALSISVDKKINYLSSIACDELAAIYSLIKDYVSAKNMLVNSSKYNIENWRNIYNSSPALEEIEIDAKEIALMYKSLFDKLFKDYSEVNTKNTNKISDFFELLIKQEKEKVENLSNLFKFGALMSGVRHEVSNLLNNINSELNKITRLNPNISEDSKKTIEYIKEKCFSGINLLYNQSVVPVRRLNRDEDKELLSTKYLLPVKLNQIIDAFSHFDVKFKINQDFGDFVIICDLLSFQMIMQSLILNSCESFDYDKNQERSIKIFAQASNDEFYRLVIEDNGVGIKAENLKNIFDIGYTTKKRSSGLGLSSVKYLLEIIKGDIEIKSEANVGTKAIISFAIKKLQNEAIIS